MPNGEGEFPKFPTLFSEEDAKRLKEIEDQRKRMLELYGQKFAPAVWDKTNLLEKAWREAASILPAPDLMRGVIPWEEYEFGFTPTQARERIVDIEGEYKELVRREKVTRQLSGIQADLMLLALAGEPIVNTTELIQHFPELKDDWAEGELGYLVSFAQSLAQASPEDIITGKFWDYQPDEKLPVTIEDVLSFFPESRPDIRFILSTVAFSRDVADIRDALAQAYPSEVDETVTGEEFRQRLLDYFNQRNIDLGITPKKGETTKEMMQRAHDQLAALDGTTVMLTNTDTGESFVARQRTDGSVWAENELIGYYDEEQDRVVPYSLNGEPLKTEQEQEAILKDIWDAFYLGMTNMWFQSKQAILSTLPDFILTSALKIAEPVTKPVVSALEKVGEEVLKGVVVEPITTGLGLQPPEKVELGLSDAHALVVQEFKNTFRQEYARLEQEQQQWLLEHPEMQPRPEWVDKGIVEKIKEDPKVLIDPGYIGYIVSSSAAFTLSYLAASTLGTLATGNPWAGLAIGATITSPTMIQDLHEDLLINGATEDQAALLSTPIGTVISSVELIGGFPVLKAILPRSFTQALRKNITREVASRTFGSFALRGLKTFTSIEIAETLEEVAQGAIQAATVKTFNENRSVLENIPDTVLQTLIAVAPLAIFGAGMEYRNFRASLPPAVNDKIDEDVATLKEAGIPDAQANTIAYVRFAETEEGQRLIQSFVEKTDMVAPVTPEVAVAKTKVVTERITSQLQAIDEDVRVFSSSHEAAVVRLEKLRTSKALPGELAEGQETVTNLADELNKLQAKRTRLQSTLRDSKAQEEMRVNYPAPPWVETWDNTSVPTRIALAKEAGLDGKIGAKNWGELSPEQQDKIIATAQKATEEVKALPSPEPEEKVTAPTSPYPMDREGYPRVPGLNAQMEAARNVISGNAGASKYFKPPTDFDSIPDNSVGFASIREALFSSRYHFMDYQEKLGLPFYAWHERVDPLFSFMKAKNNETLDRIGKDERFIHIRNDSEALERVRLELEARRTKEKSPAGLTEAETQLADVVEDIFRSPWETRARYMRAEETFESSPNLDALKKAFPDAPESDLQDTLNLLQARDEAGLYSYLDTKTWGMVENGYNPWIASNPTLFARTPGMGFVPGAGRLMSRGRAEMPEMQMNIIETMSAYLRSMSVRWYLRHDITDVENMYNKSVPKLTGEGEKEMRYVLSGYLKEAQGFYERGSVGDRFLRRVYNQVVPVVFVHPGLALRNLFQAHALYPYRTELFRVLVDPPSSALKAKGLIFYEKGGVKQISSISDEWLRVGGKPLLNFPPFSWGIRAVEKISLFPHSDNPPRANSFMAGLAKAERAAVQFKKDDNVKNYINESGAVLLRRTEQEYIVGLLLQDNIDFGVDGLRNLTGIEASSILVAKSLTADSNFKYERRERAPVEWRTSGRVWWSLFTYPRSYFERIYFKFQNVFGKEASFAERRAGFKDIILLMVMGTLVGESLKKLMSRRIAGYSPWEALQWELGGLAVGAVTDLGSLFSNTIVALAGDEESKKRVLSQLPGQLSRGGDLFIPFYKILIDSINAYVEAAPGSGGVDVQFLRELRGIIDDNYTAEELEKMETTLWEKMQQSFLGGKPAEPDVWEAAVKELRESQARLGEMDSDGRFYTLKSFAGDVERITKPIPNEMVTEQFLFSELTVFYKESAEMWEELYNIQSTPASVRREYREKHPELEARLLFWGRYSESVFPRRSAGGREVASILQTWFDYYKIDKRMHGEWSNWVLPVLPVKEAE